MKKNYFFIMIVLGFYSCQKEISTEVSNTNTSTQVDVYVAGADSINYENLGLAAYWKNGDRPVYYTDGTVSYSGGEATATAIAVNGNDVYMTGYRYGCGPFRCYVDGIYWKNGISEYLNLPTYPSSLIISNNDIYLAGSSRYLDGTGGDAAYLKNEIKVDLPSGSAGAISTAIAVSGSDVYVSGIGITGNIYYGSHYYVAKYWKNSNSINLSDGINDANTTSIAISGNDVYVAGMEWNGRTYQDASGNTLKKSVAKYWENGTAIILTDGTEDGVANSIAVSGNDIYVAGSEWNGRSYQDATGYTYKKSVAKYWKNGKSVILTDGAEDADAKSIAVNENDVYVAGTMNGHATYWKNGVAVKLSNAESDATSIFLVKK